MPIFKTDSLEGDESPPVNLTKAIFNPTDEVAETVADPF
jgi:hypothetical protein